MIRPRSRISGQIRKLRSASGGRARKGEPAVLPARMESAATGDLKQIWFSYFADRGWKPLDFQKEAWRKFAGGADLIVSVPTGSGKTLAAYGGAFMALSPGPGYRVVYVTPLRALVRDIQRALADVSRVTRAPVYVEGRTGDLRAGDDDAEAQVLVTTPESLSAMLARHDANETFGAVATVIVDEAHEIFSSKRGSLLELDLAYLRTLSPDARTIVVSATVANPFDVARRANPRANFELVNETAAKSSRIRALETASGSPLGYFGFAGIRCAPDVMRALSPDTVKILFANTRAQAEGWFAALQALNVDGRLKIALHHGSIDRAQRILVENELKSADLNLMVATSSLELGVDFPAVESVFQVGTSKKVTRAVQRAGRGFHAPGKRSELVVIPTSVFDVFEIEALNALIQTKTLEPIAAPHQPLDVLSQFLQTRATREGFTVAEAKALMRDTVSFRDVGDPALEAILKFLVSGGAALGAYPNFHKLEVGHDGRYRFADRRLARRHLFNVGTIVDSSRVQVKYLAGGYVGSLDEGFVSRLSKGDVFSFAGKTLEYVWLRDMTLSVRVALRKPEHLSVWGGSSLPISQQLSGEITHALQRVARNSHDPYWTSVLNLQSQLSKIPDPDEILIERFKTRDGFHTFLYFFEGRLSHEGIGHLLAYRISRQRPLSFSIACNDYGIELMSAGRYPDDQEILDACREVKSLERDVVASLNFPELSKRKFREVAAIAGLAYQRAPGREGVDRHLQISTGTLFDILKKYDPGHPLVEQAENEVLQTQLDLPRIRDAFRRFARSRFSFVETPALTPFALPVYLERVRSRVSTESLEYKIARLQQKTLKAAHAD